MPGRRQFAPKLLAVVLLAGGGWEAKAMPDSPAEKAVSESKALAAVGEFLRVEGRRMLLRDVTARIGPSSVANHPNLGLLRVYRGGLGTFWISPRGNVVLYSDALPAARRAFTEEQARTAAQRFAGLHISDFTSRNFVLRSSEPVRDRIKVRWEEEARRPREVSIFPNWVEVEVSLPAAAVVRFNASDLRLVRTTPVRLDEQTARARIRKKFEKAAIEEIGLMELPSGGKVITVWTAEVLALAPEGPVPERVTINADTGETVP